MPALLVIDSSAPHVRGLVLEQAVAHRPGLWTWSVGPAATRWRSTGVCARTSHRYAFQWSEDPTPRFLIHLQHQQDALRHSWDGPVAGTDGSVDERTEVMGAGYVLGAGPLPIISFFARVGGPLASARAEAASLLQLLRDVRQWYSNHVHLLIFVDCLVVLDIIRKWGRNDFHPSPKEVVHFAVIYPLLQELRQWLGRVTLVKVKKPHRMPSE